MIKKILLVLISVSILCLSGCNNMGNNYEDIGDLYNVVAEVFNVRYNPNIVDMDLIQNNCNEDTINKIQHIIQNENNNTFINLEDYFEIYGNNIIEEEDGFGNIIQVNLSDIEDTDEVVTELDGKRGVYVHDVYIKDNGKFDIKICGNYIEVEVPDNVMLGQMLGNPSYLFKVESYNYYDDTTFIVTMVSDIERVFEEDIKNKIVINNNVAVEGDLDTVLNTIKIEGKVELPQEIYDVFKEELINSYGGIRKTVKCNIIDNKIANISTEQLMSL